MKHQPFDYGNFTVEYRPEKDKPVELYRVRLDTIEEAKAAREYLLLRGAVDPLIRRVK